MITPADHLAQADRLAEDEEGEHDRERRDEVCKAVIRVGPNSRSR